MTICPGKIDAPTIESTYPLLAAVAAVAGLLVLSKRGPVIVPPEVCKKPSTSDENNVFTDSIVYLKSAPARSAKM
jgi:hypothetical protein